MTKNGVSTVLRDSNMHSSILLKASANLSGGSNKFTFTPIGFSNVGTKASGTLGMCVKDLDGNNGIDVSSSAGRVNTVRRAATAECTGPGDNLHGQQENAVLGTQSQAMHQLYRVMGVRELERAECRERL